ncbi:hypothetical protein FRX31_015587 [Thalictrum thalictroides]|uniref:Reverse transcriptase n=1 Tax=Thalictrum thalictroides TaxID=46969 RepID=A0A7J6WEK8_THATH|nr:hypothetical protein FRX31_015587 [Thalictrum thalictroides]
MEYMDIQMYIPVSFSILIEGSSVGFFRSKRGIHQGDPITHFLYLIVSEASSRMMRRVATGKGQIYYRQS